jgi:hypothetical protein
VSILLAHLNCLVPTSGVRFHELGMREAESTIGLARMRVSKMRDLIEKFVDTKRSVVRPVTYPHILLWITSV